MEESEYLETNEHTNMEEEKQIEKDDKRDKNDSSNANINMNDSVNDETCPICMDQWTSLGDHHLCCLKCGHLFGYNCIVKWLQSCNSSNRRCPQCNTKARLHHVRSLYARKLISIDANELKKMKNTLLDLKSEKNQLQCQLSRNNMRLKIYEPQLSYMKTRIAELETRLIQNNDPKYQYTSNSSTKKFNLKQTINICKDGGCRILDYNPWHKYLVVSQKTENPLFPGFGIRKIDPENTHTQQFIWLHNQVIRDLTFYSKQQKLLLSVGFDKCAKLMDVQNNMIVHKYETELPLWSCCWSGDNPNAFLVGAQNGSITQFDIRQTSIPTNILINSDGQNSGPVVSLATLPPNFDNGIQKGGFIACCLNKCYIYEARRSEYLSRQIILDGPFISVRYDEKNNHALISTRTNAKQQYTRHIVCTIKSTNEEIMHNTVCVFSGDNFQRFLSRPCYIYVENDMLVAAYKETCKSLSLWSITSGNQLQTIPVDPSDCIMDLCSFNVQNDLLLASLSTTKLRLYNYISL